MVPAPESPSSLGPISIAWPKDWALTDSRLGAYEKCPRRFFYTRVLGLGGARKPTAFSRTHDCLYDLLRWLADARRTSTPTLAAAAAAFEAIWARRGGTAERGEGKEGVGRGRC